MTRKQKIHLSAPFAILLLAAVAFLALRGTSSHAAPLSPPQAADPILEVSDWTLTDYQAAATAGQGVLPGPEFRGVNLDGSLRSPAAIGMHLAGNPFGSPASGTRNVGGVDLTSGAVVQHDVDLALPADGPTWIIGRSYNNRQEGGSTVSDGWQGKNWFQTAHPEIVLAINDEEPAKPEEDTLYLVYGADRFVEFKRVDSTSDTYRATNGAAGAFVHDDNDGEASIQADTWVYTDQWSYTFHFFGFDDDASDAKGQLWKIVAPSGEEAFAGDSDLQNDPITLGYNLGRMAEAFDSEDRRFTFTYSGSRLTSVKAESKESGTWGDTGDNAPAGVDELALVTYTYYGAENYGEPGDLKSVEITTLLNDDGNTLTREKYYRYWEGAFNASTNPGEAHSLKTIYDYEGVRRYDWSIGSTFNGSHLGASDALLADYAAASFEYDSTKAVTKSSAGAGCGSCGGSSYGDSEFTYSLNGSFSAVSGYDTEWYERGIVERPDGSYLTQYFDEVGQVLGSVITDADPSTGTPDTWATDVVRNGNGVVTEVGTPASVTGYTHSTGTITTAYTSGLIRYWTLETTGATKGYATEQKFNRDKNTSEYFEWTRTFATQGLTVSGTTVYRAVTDDQREFPVAITTGTTGSNLTARAFTWHSGKLMVDQVTVTHPAVSAANNGSAAATTSKQVLDKVGRVVWTEAEDDIINYTEFSGGLAIKEILDADTSKGASGEDFYNITIPSGWSTSGAAFHRVSTTIYDDGFSPEHTAADDTVTLDYSTVLADRRVISLLYPHVSGTTHYGPVEFRVTNHSRRSEAHGRIALSGGTTTTSPAGTIDEADSDPLAAVDVGAICRYRTSEFDSSGRQIATTKAYFDVPSTSPGAKGTNYDETTYSFDSMGRPSGSVEPSGTIYASIQDVLGRTIERQVGTDDSATGANNMVVTELIEYDDNGDGGNSHLTEQTARTTSTSTGQRVTKYTYDLRGNRLLVEGDLPPHTLVKHDNLGRNVATGLYDGGTPPSSTADPETLSTSRLALSSATHDERGRIARSFVYNIDPVYGSNDGSLRVDNWYDPVGRRIKAEGTQLTKMAYDRLGRQTHRFVLATDNDSRSYAAADDVAGDTVLIESQAVYESGGSDDVLMTVAIERFHDDHTTSPTAGPLDTNADSDALKITAANIEGRVQITGMWYDDVGRIIDSVNYGTNAEADYDRDGITDAPARSATKLRTTFAYDDDGNSYSTTDPKDIEDRVGFDDLGRQTWTARNYEDEIPDSGEEDRDQIVRFAYTDGLRTTYTADLPTGSTDQVTTYFYGTDGGGATGDSDIATGHLLHQIAYPDSTGASDRVTYAYNAQSQQTYTEDQDGTVMDTSFDDSGRRTKEVASTLATGIDGAVRRKAFAYDGLGRMTTATQYDATTAGSVVDQFEYTYGEWGRMTAFDLDVDSTVGSSGIAAYMTSIDYDLTWAGAAPTTRSGSRAVKPLELTMPTGLAYSFVQETTGYHRETGRTNSVTHRGTAVATFEFVGSRRVSSVTVEEFDFVMDYSGSSSGSYEDWDDFNRIKADEWVVDPGGSNKTFLHRGYNLDEGGFITGIYDYIEKSGGPQKMDTLVTLDDLYRITRLERGTLNGGGTAITGETMDQNRTFDLVGNVTARDLDWDADDDYTGTDEYDDTFTHNDVNEITSGSMSWSGAGALEDDGDDRKYVYDAWGRMVQVQDGASAVIGNYRRSALDHLIGVQLDREPDSDLDAADWHYMVPRPSDGGLLAEFSASDADALVERLWLGDFASSATGSFYCSAIIEERDDDTDGTLDRTTVLFVDRTGSVFGNWGDASGKQVERIHYDADGVPYLVPWGDTDADGDADSTDAANINLWVSFSIYSVRGDLDLDGDVDGADYAAFQSATGGVATLSTDRNCLGWAGLLRSGASVLAWRRTLKEGIGSWLSRDEMDYIDGSSLYQSVRGNSLGFTDRDGLCSQPVARSQSSPKTNESRPPDAVEEDPWWQVPVLWDCCRQAKEAGLNDWGSGPVQGTVICCKGHAVVCEWSNTGWPGDSSGEGVAEDAKNDCIRAHEQEHADKHIQSCKGVKGPALAQKSAAVTTAQAEYFAHKVQEECLDAAADRCKKLSSTESRKCLARLKRYQDHVEERRKKHQKDYERELAERWHRENLRKLAGLGHAGG